MESKLEAPESRVRSTKTLDAYEPTHVASLVGASSVSASSVSSWVLATISAHPAQVCETESHATSSVAFTHPSTHSALVATLSSEHRENAPMNSCMPRIPKMSQNSSATSTFPSPGSERSSASTTTRSSGTREMTRSGRSTRMVRARAPTRCSCRSEPSENAHQHDGAVHDVPGVPEVRPVSLLEPNPERGELHEHLEREQHGEAPVRRLQRARESGVFIAFGDSNAISTEDAAMQNMINASKRLSSTIA